MAFGNSPTTGSQGALGSNQIPLGSVAVPGAASGNLTALEGGPASTDSNGNLTAPASMYIKDGSDVTKGTQADAAWSGSGAATEIAILKKLAALLTAALPLPTGAAIEAGHLATIDSHTPALGQTTMSGSSPMVLPSNQSGIGTVVLPNIMEDTVRNATRAGNAFFASTEELSPANANTAYSLFNPVASGKTLILHSVNLQYSGAQQFIRMRVVNANPSFAVTLSAAGFNLGNALAGGGNASIASVTYATATTTAPALSAASLAYGVMTQATNLTNELLTNGKTIALPAGTGFIAYFSNAASGTLIFSFYWLEI